jgi:hypothetical protein
VYNLSFYEAIEKCINGEGCIRGDKFKDGVYVKKQGETLIAYDGFNSNKIVGNLFISLGIMSQKYKLFKSIKNEELKSDKSVVTFLNCKSL